MQTGQAGQAGQTGQGRKLTATKRHNGVTNVRTNSASSHRDTLTNNNKKNEEDVNKSRTHAAKHTPKLATSRDRVTATNAPNREPPTMSDTDNQYLTSASNEPLTESDIHRLDNLSDSDLGTVWRRQDVVQARETDIHTHACDVASADVSSVWRNPDIVHVLAEETNQHSLDVSCVDQDHARGSDHAYAQHRYIHGDEVKIGLDGDDDDDDDGDDDDDDEDDLEVLRARENDPDPRHSETSAHNLHTRETQYPGSESKSSVNSVNTDGEYGDTKTGHPDSESLWYSRASDRGKNTNDHFVQENRKTFHPDSESVWHSQVRASSESAWPSHAETVHTHENDDVQGGLQAWSDVDDTNAGMQFSYVRR